MTSSKTEQHKDPVSKTVVGSESPQSESATAQVVDTLSAVTISGHEQESESQTSSLVVQGTETDKFVTAESESGGVLAIGRTELSTNQVGLEQNLRMSTVLPVSQVEQNVPMNVDGVEHSKVEENIKAEASQMEFGSTQAIKMGNATVVQGMNISALTEGQRAQLLRALQEDRLQGLSETSNQSSHGQHNVGFTQPEGGAEDKLWQRGGFPLAMVVSSPKGMKPGTLADSVEKDKSLGSQGVGTPDKTQMETDGGEEQDSKMELGSVDDKEMGQWSSGEESGVEEDKTDRSHSRPSQEEETEGEHSNPQKDVKSPHPDKIEGARRVREHDCQFPPTELFITHKPVEDDDPAAWYQGEDCADPNGFAMASNKMALPTPDGDLSGNGNEPLPGPSGRTRYRDRSLE